ncbi:16S rRNA (uracil(1498)-N(3))-methyltransferase [Thiobacter aerophilum]|uniref:Ribosomal RNA small subunit methyltransferase E n=1 Tax=Thiobacter aerophilum TaxID=3121275 RepID=A0ABV0EGE3_9BURK
MRLPRFHCPGPLVPGMSLPLPPEASHHALHVLRMKEDDALFVFDGEGREFRARIQRIERKVVTLAVEDATSSDPEPPFAVILGQGIASGERMDYTLQKAVELGVTEIWPIAAQRSVVRLTGERADKRLSHWRRVVIAACEQSGRSRVPPVHPPLRLSDWLATVPAGLRLMLSPEATTRLGNLAAPQGPVILLVGPEGGLSEAERTLAQSRGFEPVRLGPRILRTETAALAALAAMHALWGDF